jgi:unsaturated chondroitin disaccharide hydrolase
MTNKTAKNGAESPAGAKPAELAAAFDLCARKSRRTIALLASHPKSYAFDEQGDYARCEEGFYDIGNWTSSFFTGMALLAWRQTRDDYFLNHTLRLAPFYQSKVAQHGADTMHDLGFLYSLYSVGLYRLTGDQAHRKLGLQAAELLAGRFVAKGGYIRAWGRMDETGTPYDGLAIIDCLMNLPLLYWAAQEEGHRRLYDVARRHADTTVKLFYRRDISVYHAYRFDTQTGQPLRPDNYGGYAVESHWARGTAWAIYGFALSYRYTNDIRFLATSLRLALKFVQNVEAEIVPSWDFNLPPGEERLRDASAAAIAVCGLQELARHCPQEEWLAQAARRMLHRLCQPDYLEADESCLGILRLAQVGHQPGQARNAFTSWGDYFLMEALSRELALGETFW